MLHPSDSLEGKILIASPSMDASCYLAKSVIYVLRHSIEGATGLIINRPLPKLDGHLVVRYEKEDISLKPAKAYFGGPLETEKGFVLHVDNESDGLISLSFDVGVLKALARKKKASKTSLLCFGYCGWICGQLEDEIMDNVWMVASPDKRIIFEIENHHKWDMYLNAINVNPSQYVDCEGSC